MPKSKKKVITLVVDPLPSGFSVQMTFLKSVIEILGDKYDLSVYSNYFSQDKKEELIELGLRVVEKKGGFISKILKNLLFPHLNESLLWSLNWFFDALEISRLNFSDKSEFSDTDYVIDLSATVMPKSDIWWIQGPPFYEVVESMSSSNIFIKFFFRLFDHKLKRTSINIINEKSRRTKQMVAVSNYIKSIYRSYGIIIPYVVHSSQNFNSFNPCMPIGKEDYVLTYIGKETDTEALIEAAKLGINIVGFGSKIPPGMGLQKLKKHITFLGKVSNEELIKLYSGAKFFAFPFTNEPFGVTPIESMLCGVPVLTYNKEGPAETVIDGKTGWLVNSREDFVQKAHHLWMSHDLDIDPKICVKRGSELRLKYQIDKLIDIMVSVTA